jgi:acyl-CoA reductase-like NAD-dependent aldehyde dehydrogenase
MKTYQMCIDGQWCDSESGQTFDALNPATGKPFARIARGTRDDARRAIASANEAYQTWSHVPLWERAALCMKMADVVLARQDDLAAILCTELGKPRQGEAIEEVVETPANFRYAAEQAKWLEGTTIPVQDPTKRVFSIRRPRGVIAVLTPWNFPCAIPTEYLPYAIVMGNTVVWNPASTASAIAVVLFECMLEAGLPKGVINLVTGPGREVGDEIVTHRGTAAICMTGGTQAGEIVCSRAGIKPKLMELGGNGPTMVLADADPVAAAEAIAPACFYAAGQVCSATERIFVAEPIKQAFVDTMVKLAADWAPGDPTDKATIVGPQNNLGELEKIEQHLQDAVSKGAKILTGGQRANLPGDLSGGYFFEPTVLVDFSMDALMNLDETFGPLAKIASFASEEQAWRMVRSCDLGLVSAVFTEDIDAAWHWAEHLPGGITVVNNFSNYWELHIPFGGSAGTRSGIGRLGGRHTLEFMTDLKTIAFHMRKPATKMP